MTLQNQQSGDPVALDSDPSTQEFLAPYIEQLAGHRRAFQEAFDRHRSLVDETASQEREALNAETEAQAAKVKIREALREGGGRPSKKMHSLLGEQRAAYALAEEYRSLGKDIALERDRAEIAMHEAAKNFMDEKQRTTEKLAAFLLDKFFTSFPPELMAGMRLLEQAQVSGKGTEWKNLPYIQLIPDIETFVTNKVATQLIKALKQDKKAPQWKLPAELMDPLPCSGYGGLSFLQMKKLREDLAARERAMESE